MSVLRRTFGDIEVSQVAFGTMRLPEVTPDGRTAVDLLRHLAEAGVTTHHSSSEYDTYDLYCDSLRRLRADGVEIEHVTKIAAPSWEADRFLGSDLTAAVDRELGALGTDRLDVVQWLVRTAQPADVARTCAAVADHLDDLHHTVETLKHAGKIGELAAFCYHPQMEQLLAERAIGSCVTGFTPYLNLWETEGVRQADAAPCLAIRPFGGDLGAASRRAARFPLLHPNVATTIVSTSSTAHADDVVEWAGSVEADRVGFRAELAATTPAQEEQA